MIFAVGLALLASAVFFIDRRNGVDFSFGIGLWELAFVAAVTGRQGPEFAFQAT